MVTVLIEIEYFFYNATINQVFTKTSRRIRTHPISWDQHSRTPSFGQQPADFK